MTYKSSTVLLALVTALFIGMCVYKSATDNTTKNTIADNTIIVGTNAEYPPFTFIENGTYVGLDIDIVREIAQRLGKKIIIKDMPFEALIPQIQVGNIHMIAAGMSPTTERAKQVFFSAPYLTDDYLIILSRNENPVNTIEELRHKQVIVNEGFTADYYVSDLNVPHVTRLASITEALLALQTGRADAFVTARSSVQSFFALYGDDSLHQAPIPGTEERYALIVSKKYPELYAHVTEIMDTMKKDGTLAQIRKRWHL